MDKRGEKQIEHRELGQDGKTYEETLRDRAENPKQAIRKGQKGITSDGARMVRNGAFLLQKQYGKKKMAMATPTLPEIPEYLPIWCELWPELIRKLQQEIQRELKRNDAPEHIVGVTEIHSERSERLGYAVPHAHLLYIAWDGESYDKEGKIKWYISANKFRIIWYRILVNVLKSMGIYDRSIKMPMARFNVKQIRKSAEGYLGKYMSKGKKHLQEMIQKGVNKESLPRHWWHCTGVMRKVIKGQIAELPVDILTAILQKINLVARGLAVYQRPIRIVYQEVERVVGYSLKLLPCCHALSKVQIAEAFNTA